MQKPQPVDVNQELVGILIDEEYDLLYSTLEIGQQAASVISSVKSRIKVVDPSPFMSSKVSMDWGSMILFWQMTTCHLKKSDRRLIIKASEKGAFYFAGKDFATRGWEESFRKWGYIWIGFFAASHEWSISRRSCGEAVKVSGEFAHRPGRSSSLCLG